MKITAALAGARTHPRAVERVPVYHVGELTGFVQRTGRFATVIRPMDESEGRLSSDALLQRDIIAAVRSELTEAADSIRLSVAGGVVTFTGEVGNMHDKMALRRIAASMEATIAIIDDVWVPCE